jgi:class 3 adenylate cyclase
MSSGGIIGKYPWLLIVASVAALGMVTYWATGPQRLAPWNPGFYETGFLGARALKAHPPKNAANPMRDQIDKFSLPVLLQATLSPWQQRDTDPPSLAERSFTLLAAIDSALAAVLALSLFRWRRENDSARQLALALGLFAFATAGFLINGQARLRGNLFAWPSWPRLAMDVLVTLAFGLSVAGLDRFFSWFPVRLEDWQVMQTLLRWRGKSIVGEQQVEKWYRPDRGNLLKTVRKLPGIITGVLLVGTFVSTLPFVILKIRYTETETASYEIIGICGFLLGFLAAAVAAVLLLSFGWLFALGLIARLRAAREHCTEVERRQADWLFAGGLLIAIMLILVCAGLLLWAVYWGWGNKGWGVEEYGGAIAIASVLFFPAGWAVILLTLAGAVFLSRTFGPKPLLKRTILITGTGLIMSFLLATIEHAVASRILSNHTEAVQHGLSAVLAGGIVIFPLSIFRHRIEHGVDGFLNRFMPATVIADGKRRYLTVVFSDLGGFTGLSAANEAQALLAAGHFQKVAAETARRHEGRIVKTIGDAVMWVFGAPNEAIAAALDLNRDFRQVSGKENLPLLPVNSGIHSGAVVEAPDGDVYGAAVNLAGRLQGAAKDGAVVVSSETMIEVTGRFSFEPMGKLELKNVATPVACFRVVGEP